MRTSAGECPTVRIELDTGCAWCGDRLLDLTPKVFAILRYFVEHPERLITKEELLAAVWTDAVVSDAALTSCIRDLRRALDDPSRAPRYIETAHRRGFRFIGPIAAPPSAAMPPVRDLAPPQALVGRAAELAGLHALFTEALAGRRQLVFVTGEPGIGKTTLVEAFLGGLDPASGLRVGRGQCVEHYGAGEAHLPVLEALARMTRSHGGDAMVRALRQHAPTWLVQLPALLGDDDLVAVRRRCDGATRERMLRELAEALDVVSADAPVVLVLEDLHWSDSATIDLLVMLARRRDSARLLVLGTYRPADVAVGPHPLKPAKQELQAQGRCTELPLEFLGATAVEGYLAHRFPDASFVRGLAAVLHRNTNGNPLFLVNVVDDLVAHGHLRDGGGRWELAVPLEAVAPDVPDTLWQLVDKQLARLTDEERAVLAVASVAGAEFSAAMATADGIDAGAADTRCATLARRGQFLRATGVTDWPDGTVAGRYGFIHALYRKVLYERISIGQRVGLHLRIGSRLERAYGPHAPAMAGELAMHFEAGRDVERAVRYRAHAADNALRQHAHCEAANHATRALALLEALPESPERLAQELAVQTTLGAALIARGWAAPEVARTYARAHELCLRTGLTPERVPILRGLFGIYVTIGDLPAARDLASELTTLAVGTNDAAIRLAAHNAQGMVAFYSGDFVGALAELERGMAVYDPAAHSPARSPAVWSGHDTGVSCAGHAAWALWILGHPDRAVQRMAEALAWARAADHPFTLAFACHFAAMFHECRREPDAAKTLADEAVRLSTEHGFALFASLEPLHRGWYDDDPAEIGAGITAYRQTGSRFGVPTHLALLAESHARHGQLTEGLAVIDDARAIADATEAHYYDAELERLRGVLLAASAPRDAEAAFGRAIEIARRQHATTLERRAAAGLAALALR